MHPDLRHTQAASSLLDRLMDNRPDASSEASPGIRHDIAQYKRAVARDLEALLNTRCSFRENELKTSFLRASQTFLCFGIVDLSSLSLLNPKDRTSLGESIKGAIEHHESRLGNVRVELDMPKEASQTLRFRVDARLRIHPGQPPVTFDAMLQLSSNTYLVKD